MKKRQIGIVLLISILIFSGCASNEKASSPRSGMITTETASADMEMGEASKEMYGYDEVVVVEEATESLMDSNSSSVNTVDFSERKIVKTGFVYIETLEYNTALENLQRFINMYNAYTEQADSSGGRYYQEGSFNRYAGFTIKVPAENFELLLADIKTIGHVLNDNNGIQDITSQFIDVESRLSTMRIQEERLLAILEKAEKLEDVIELEYALQDVRYEIERYTTNLRNMEERVRYSTLTVNIQEVYEETVIDKPAITFTDRISDGFKRTLNNIGDGFEDFIVFLVVGSPYIIFLVVCLVVGIFILKKKSRKKALVKADEAKRIEDTKSDDTKE